MAVAVELSTAEDMAGGGGDYLEKPGRYHMMVVHAEENAKMGDNIVKGFMYELAVQAPKELAGQTVRVYFRNPDSTHKDGGKMARAKQSNALLAANVVTPSDLGKTKEVNAEDAKDNQLCIELALGEPNSKTGKQYLDLNYANIFHVDDPRAKSYPKDSDILSLIPKEYRRDEGFFAPLMVKPKTTSVQKPKDEDFDGL